MNFASIDIGTNAVLLLVMQKNAELHELSDTSTITRLGEGLLQRGALSQAAMERTVQVLEQYRDIMHGHSAKLVACFGTSAVREAENRNRFIEMVRERTGIEVQVFSEYQEAYHTYVSVRDDGAMPGERLVVVDIGGGSTEIIEGTRKSLERYVSLPVGTIKLTELFIAHDPPLPEELKRVRDFIRERLPTAEGKGASSIVGMAGTMTTLGAIVLGLKKFDKKQIHGLRLPLSTLDTWIERMGRMPVHERRTITGMEPGREDLLLQGVILMREIVSAFGGEGLTVSTYGARYGVIYEALNCSSS